MKINKLRSLVILLLVPFSTILAAIESCPKLENIHQKYGVYTAQEGDGQWFGVAHKDTGGGDIQHFLKAIYYPVNGNSMTEGMLFKCIYGLQYGTVDISFRNMQFIQRGGFFVSLMEGMRWEERRDGNKSIYVCSDRNVDNCKFSAITY